VAREREGKTSWKGNEIKDDPLRNGKDGKKGHAQLAGGKKG